MISQSCNIWGLCSQACPLSFLCPQCVKCRSAAENLTEPGTKRIWSSSFYNLDKLLLDRRVCEYRLNFFQLLSRNTGSLPPSLQCFSIAATKELVLSLLSLRWLCGCFTLWEQRSTELCVIKEKCIYLESQAEMAFGHLNLKVYSWHNFLLFFFFPVHNWIRLWNIIAQCR